MRATGRHLPFRSRDAPPDRRFKKVIKREVAAAAKAVVMAALEEREAPATKAEVKALSKQALAATYMQAYQRVKLQKEPRDPNVQCLGHEIEDGNVEYKLRLKDHSEGNPYRIQQLVGPCDMHGCMDACMH
jgi:hypothetical protein